MAAGSQKQWSLSESAFRGLLSWLDGGLDSNGEKYLETRRRLVQYFDRKNCRAPDELADETLNRVARRLADQGSITDRPPAHYCYIVARFVFLEYHRRPARLDVSLEGLASSRGFAQAASPKDIAVERRSHCLEKCLQSLAPDQRQLILEYYHGDQRAKIENRRNLARRLGLTVNALAIRACRIRDNLENCVRSCCTEKNGVERNG